MHLDSRCLTDTLSLHTEKTILSQSNDNITDSTGFSQLAGTILPVVLFIGNPGQIQHADNLHLIENQNADQFPVIRDKVRNRGGIHHGFHPQPACLLQNVPDAFFVDFIAGNAVAGCPHGFQRLVCLLFRDRLLIMRPQNNHIISFVIDQNHAGRVLDPFSQNDMRIIDSCFP